MERRSARRALLLVVALLALAAACGDDVSHENIDRWLRTEHGVDKLKAALAGDHDPDLRAHAAQVLIARDQLAPVLDTLDKLPESQRHAVVAKLAPRLWEDAKVAGERTVPNDRQWAAKDALYELRGRASTEGRAAIDRYLVEWFTGGYYEGRATVGRITGRMVIRAVGADAGPKLLEAARSIVARPPDAQGNRAKVGDELLAALALSGDKEAIDFLLQLVTSTRKDETLPRRAMGALITAYIDPVGLEPADPAALEPHLDALVGVTRDANADGVMKNDAVALIAAIGMPKCLPAFVEMINYPYEEKQFIWIGAQQGIRCGGVDAIIPVVEAIPTDGDHERGFLEKYVWDEITELSARSAVADRARTLLSSASWVARVTGVELLGKLAIGGTAKDDAKRIRDLGGDGKLLKGWWGKQKEGERKPDPTLGQVATQVANRLEEVAK